MILFKCNECGEPIQEVLYTLQPCNALPPNRPTYWRSQFHWHCLRVWVLKNVPEKGVE